MTKISLCFFISVSFMLCVSCEGDCKDVQIEKAEWITRYVNKTKDTLVAYSVVESKREYISSYKEVMHTITIKNTNKSHANIFAVKINYGYYDPYNGKETRSENLDYVSIAPRSTHTFTFYSQAGHSVNLNNNYTILQVPASIRYKEKVDELKTEKITVNSCQENIEALREKYKIIKQLYYSKADSLKSHVQKK